jgi:hypothetical protein
MDERDTHSCLLLSIVLAIPEKLTSTATAIMEMSGVTESGTNSKTSH